MHKSMREVVNGDMDMMDMTILFGKYQKKKKRRGKNKIRANGTTVCGLLGRGSVEDEFDVR